MLDYLNYFQCGSLKSLNLEKPKMGRKKLTIEIQQLQRLRQQQLTNNNYSYSIQLQQHAM